MKVASGLFMVDTSNNRGQRSKVHFYDTHFCFGGVDLERRSIAWQPACDHVDKLRRNVNHGAQGL